MNRKDERLAIAVIGALGLAAVAPAWAQQPAAKERIEVEEALSRFLAWHARSGGRTVLATEQELHTEVTLPDGQRVLLHGYADRLELDESGRVWVIDLKTTKYPPTDKELAENPQLGLYQHAVNHGAVDDLVAGGAQAGGAELIQLRRSVRGSVKVQAQQPQVPDASGHRPVEVQLMRAAEAIRSETFPAQSGQHCDRCQFQAVCPIKGAGTVLS